MTFLITQSLRLWDFQVPQSLFCLFHSKGHKEFFMHFQNVNPLRFSGLITFSAFWVASVCLIFWVVNLKKEERLEKEGTQSV